VRFVTLIGNPKAASRTATVARAAGDAVIAAAGVQPRQETVDLSALACRLLLAQPSAAVEDAVAQVLGADVLLVVSPTFKGTYTGLLKVFLDRLGYRALAGTVALPVLVMKHPEHALAVEVHLRPLLVELGATVPSPGLAVQEAALGRLDPVLTTWARRVADAVASAGAGDGTAANGGTAGHGGTVPGGVGGGASAKAPATPATVIPA
jgi:FMN reductase